MKLRAADGRTVPGRSRDITELAVMVRFRDIVVAIAAERVSRIVPPDEVQLEERVVPHVRIGAQVLPAWDMGQLLGFSDPPAAWLILRTGDAADTPEIALATGRCIAIAPHDPASPLPAGVITAPPAAVVGVFVIDPVLRERGVGRLGLRIDPTRLIGAAALAAAHRGRR